MRKLIYLVQSCPLDEFRAAAKSGYPCDLMGLKARVLPVWATGTKKEAIQDCIQHNKNTFKDSIYFMTEIKLFY